MIQTAPLPPDVTWYLDCALEHDELDGGSHLALKLYADRKAILAIVDDPPDPGDYFIRDPKHTRLGRKDALKHLADATLAALPDAERGAVAWAGVQHIRMQIDQLANTLAGWAHEDSIIGGCMLPWKRVTTKWTDRYILTKRQERDLHSRNWIKRYVKHNDDSRRLRLAGGRAMARFAGIDLAMVRQSGDKLANDLHAQHEGYRRWNEYAIRSIARARGGLPDSDRAARRKRRKVIKRAATTAVALLGTATVSAFAQGRPVVLAGQMLSLEVARLGSSATLGHAGLHVAAVDPQNQRKLADLCVYHEQTPALDQLTALALSMQAGEESDIIQTANMSGVTDLGRAHPLILQRGRAQPIWQPRDQRQMGNEAYWQSTKPIWIETLGVYVLGRLWRLQ